MDNNHNDPYKVIKNKNTSVSKVGCPPASMRSTFTFSFARLLATMHPAVPPPTIMKSAECPSEKI